LLKAFEKEVYLVKLCSRKIRAAVEEQKPQRNTECLFYSNQDIRSDRNTNIHRCCTQ